MKPLFFFVISLLMGPVYSLKAQSIDTLTISPIAGNVIDSAAPNKHSSILGNDRKWSFSLFIGFSLLGPVNDMEKQMEDAGLGTSGYPTHRTAAVWNIETRYTLSKKSALNLTLGEINNSTVEGFKQSGFEIYYGDRLNIKSEVFSAAFNYIWRTGTGNSGFNLGPVIALHKINTDDYSYTPVTTTTTSSTITAGFNLGYTLALIQKKSWFLAIKANYTWLPDATIGPYTIQQSSVFQETKISISTINIGVATGWRL